MLRRHANSCWFAARLRSPLYNLLSGIADSAETGKCCQAIDAARFNPHVSGTM